MSEFENKRNRSQHPQHNSYHQPYDVTNDTPGDYPFANPDTQDVVTQPGIPLGVRFSNQITQPPKYYHAVHSESNQTFYNAQYPSTSKDLYSEPLTAMQGKETKNTGSRNITTKEDPATNVGRNSVKISATSANCPNIPASTAIKNESIPPINTIFKPSNTFDTTSFTDASSMAFPNMQSLSSEPNVTSLLDTTCMKNSSNILNAIYMRNALNMLDATRMQEVALLQDSTNLYTNNSPVNYMQSMSSPSATTRGKNKENKGKGRKKTLEKYPDTNTGTKSAKISGTIEAATSSSESNILPTAIAKTEPIYATNTILSYHALNAINTYADASSKPVGNNLNTSSSEFSVTRRLDTTDMRNANNTPDATILHDYNNMKNATNIPVAAIAPFQSEVNDLIIKEEINDESSNLMLYMKKNNAAHGNKKGNKGIGHKKATKKQAAAHPSSNSVMTSALIGAHTSLNMPNIRASLAVNMEQNYPVNMVSLPSRALDYTTVPNGSNMPAANLQSMPKATIMSESANASVPSVANRLTIEKEIIKDQIYNLGLHMKRNNDLLWVKTSPKEAEFIPFPPVVAGYDCDHCLLWVIRAPFEGGVFPGKLRIKDHIAYIPWNGKEHSVTCIEVCCARPGSVRWLKMEKGMIPYNSILGGKTPVGEPLYIGRVYIKGSLTPGMVLGSRKCIYISFDGHQFYSNDYEILVAAAE